MASNSRERYNNNTFLAALCDAERQNFLDFGPDSIQLNAVVDGVNNGKCHICPLCRNIITVGYHLKYRGVPGYVRGRHLESDPLCAP